MGEQRQFKLDLGESKSEDFGEKLQGTGGEGWKVQKKLFQGVEVEKMKGLFGESEGKNIYKLVLKKEVETESKDVFEGVGVKGAFGLVKATWKGSKGEDSEWKVEDIAVNESNKVWLIVAKGEKAMYLMPLLRSATWKWGKSESYCSVSKNKEEAEKKINEKGVEGIKQWNSEFDLRKDWQEDKNLELQKLMNAGFSITRKAEAVILGGRGQGFEWKGTEGGEGMKRYQKGGKYYSEAKERKVKFLYKNAGILNLSDLGEGTKKCNEIEHYYPLDLVILNKTSEETEGKVTVDNEGKITITDTISEVYF